MFRFPSPKLPINLRTFTHFLKWQATVLQGNLNNVQIKERLDGFNRKQ